jgi:penicillin-binding protein 1A
VSKGTRANKPAGKNKPRGSWLGMLGKMLVFLIILMAIPVGYFGAKIYQQLKDMPDIAILEKYEPIEAIQVFDRNDKLVCTVEGDEDRRVVPLSEISTQMQQAMLAAEDHHFYEHHGINPASIIRAFVTNLQAGKVKEGGSTITQQLIKNLFFEDKGRTFDRKVKEAFMSYEVEQRYSKDRILEMYLNQVYFGNGGYGIERGAQRYFGRSASALDLAQAAFMAGLVKAPSELGNPENRREALDRQQEILDRLVEFGYVTKDQADKAKKEKLLFKQTANPLQKYSYYISYVLEQLRGRFSEAEMRRQGLHVYTNLDPQVQQLAEHTLNEDIKHAPKGVSQSALVCLSVKDSAVLALVGGVGDFWKNQFNRATNPHTAGSSFKPFVYLTAFMRNVFHPDSFIDDSPITIKQGWGLPDWTPHNFDHKFLGKITIKKALSQSRNVPAVKVGQRAGIENVVETARQAGITTKLDANLSLALGSSAVTPLDMAGAYSTFARGGIAIKPQLLRRIENNRGQVIELFEPKADKVFDTDAVACLLEVMQEVVKSGTGAAARLPDRPVAGKTGTADQGKDIWFCGFTPDTVCVLWGGNDENLPIPGHNVTGGAVMAKIWKDFMVAYYQMRPTAPGAFITPSKNLEPITDQQQQKQPAGAGPDSGMPNLVPLQTEGDNAGGNELVPATPGGGGTAPPAVSPTNTIPETAPPPASSGTMMYPPVAPDRRALYAVPNRGNDWPPSVPANNAPYQPSPTPMPAPAPAIQGYGGSPYTNAVGGASRGYNVSAGGSAVAAQRAATVMTSSGSQRTIINENGGPKYFSVSDPNAAGAGAQRRSLPTGSTSAQPANNNGSSPGF